MIKLIALDMDGTITQHKKKLEAQNRKALELLSGKFRLAVVGAGGCGRIRGQLEFEGLDLIGNYGMQEMLFDEQSKSYLISKDKKEAADRESIAARVKGLRELYGFEEISGDSVEFHGCGMVTIPLLGTKAKQDQKLAFDPQREKRRTIYPYVSALFPEYNVFVGGSSSFDMTPRPYDKLYALSRYAEENCILRQEIVYIGDDYGYGGNDEPIYRSDIEFVTIDNYMDFSRIAEELYRRNT